MQPGTLEQYAATTWPSDLALIDVTETEDNIGANASGYWGKKKTKNKTKQKKHLAFKWVYFFVQNPSAKLGDEQ